MRMPERKMLENVLKPKETTVPLKSKLPPSRETRFSSRETRLSSRERLKNTVSINACRSCEIKTSVVKLRTRCREAS